MRPAIVLAILAIAVLFSMNFSSAVGTECRR